MVTYVLALCLTVHLCRRSALSRIQPLSHASKSFGRASSPSIRSEAPSFIVARAAKPPTVGAKHQSQNVFAARRRKHSCLRYTGEPRNAPQALAANLTQGERTLPVGGVRVFHSGAENAPQALGANHAWGSRGMCAVLKKIRSAPLRRPYFCMLSKIKLFSI